MSSGDAALLEMIERLRTLGEAPAKIAPEVGEAVHVEISANIAAGRAPDGTPWPPTAAGERPLKRAAKALSVRAVGSRVVIRISGPETLHHLGTARGRVRRQILPNAKLPDPITRAIHRVITRRIGAALGGTSG